MSDVSGASSGSSMLENDNHFFKWVDEALLEEINVLKNKMSNLEELVKEVMMERGESEKKVFEKMEMKLETELFDKMEEVLKEAKWSMKKMCAGQIGAIQLCISRALQNWDPHMRTALPAGKQDTKRIVKSGYNVLQLLSVCPVRYIVC
uniref:Uncharacterized protein n=1 Tax=Brassica campestris TaxID=3711 RepID=M4DNC4_BRACM